MEPPMTCYPDADWSCYPAVDTLDDAVKARSELLGWSALNALIAYQVPGDCPVTVRPCVARLIPPTWFEAGIGGSTFTPYIGAGGHWINACGCVNNCECLGTKLAAGRLAAEFAKSCLNQSCALPANVTAVTRQGVTQEFQQNPFDQATTGMPDVDAIVRIFNPYGLKTPPVVMSVDVRGRTRTL
jgi:hypothetical protein